jgi:hypothetical protein
MKGLERNPDHRFQTAREFAIALESSVPLSTTRAVGEWVERSAHAELERRSHMITDIESASMSREDLERYERESEAPPSGRTGEPSSISEVNQASGSRRVQRPATPRSEDVSTAVEEPSAKSASTSAVSSLAVPKPASAPAPAKGAGSHRSVRRGRRARLPRFFSRRVETRGLAGSGKRNRSAYRNDRCGGQHDALGRADGNGQRVGPARCTT